MGATPTARLAHECHEMLEEEWAESMNGPRPGDGIGCGQH
jgi:hypothetical protein